MTRVLFLPRVWNLHGLSDWLPATEYDSVGCLFSHWGSWPDADEKELQLYAHELQAYMDPALGSDKRLLELQDVANTLLHLWIFA